MISTQQTQSQTQSQSQQSLSQIPTFFNCYSVPLKNYLLTHEFRYASVGINPKTKKTYWLFVNDERFKQALTRWSMTKPT